MFYSWQGALSSTNASRLNPESKGYKVLAHIMKSNGATKYDCVTKILGVKGSKEKLRGYYSVTFQGWVKNGIVTHNQKNYEYTITEKGINAMKIASKRKPIYHL